MKKTFGTLICISLFLASCGDSKEKQVDEHGTTTTSAVPESKFDSNEFIGKYNAYIDFGNAFHKRANDTYNHYFDWASVENGPKGAKNIKGVYTLPEHSLNALEKGLEMNVEIDGVDAPMKVVHEKAKNLFNVLEEADGYYKKQDYKDDAFVKGQELHERLKTAFDAYFIAYDTMFSEFVVVQDELFAFDVEKFKSSGQLIKYNLMMGLHTSEAVLDVIGGLDGPELKNIDMKAFDTKVAEFRLFYDALEKLAQDETQFKKEYGTSVGAKHSLKSFITTGEQFIREIRNLKERVEEGDFKYSIVHPSIPDNGSPLKLSKTYSKMVNEYNRIQ